MKLPEPVLGNITAITISTPDLEKSLAFYQQLGFSLVQRADWPFPWIQVSDGALLIMLRKDPKPYMALTYYVNNIADLASSLKKKGIKFDQEPKKGDMIKRYVIQSPGGLNVSLVGITEGFSQPPGPTMLQMKQEDYFNPAKYLNKKAGMYGELAHPVADLDAAIAFWDLLGYKPVSRFSSPYPWAILSDGLGVVGIHQTTHFSFPAITYFAADMAEKIAALKKAGLKNMKEQGPSNAVLTTPEQQHIFLYHLGGAPAESTKKELNIPVIETERLLLRLITPETTGELFSSFDDNYIMSFLGLSAAELKAEKEKWEKGMTTYRTSFRRFFIVLKETGKVIGSIGYHNWYAEHRRSEIGYHLSTEAVRGKGYMTEAMTAVLAHGFGEMELNRVEAFTSPDNVPSRRMLENFGFTEEGTLRAHFYKDGKMHDSVCYGILKKEYGKQKKARKK